jgi:hypothetical protein
LDNGKNNEVLLKELELYITKETGFNIKFKIKPFDELFYSENLDKINVPEVEDLDTKLRLVEDEKEGADILFEELKEDLKYCNNQLFFKNNNVWTSTDKTTYSCVMDYVMSSNIKTIDAKGNVKAFAQNYNCADHIVKTIINKAVKNPNDVFYQKFHTTTKGKLCFEDGVLDLINKQFYKWDDDYLQENPVYSTVLIHRNFYESFCNPNIEIINKVEEKVFDAIFDEQKEKALHFLSRAFAGHYEDKDWAVFIGNRNCGKGVLDLLMKNAMEGCMHTTSAGNFMCKRTN